VSVWAGWCPACQTDLPQMDAVPVRPEEGFFRRPPSRSFAQKRWLVLWTVVVVAAGAFVLVGNVDHRSQPSPRPPFGSAAAAATTTLVVPARPLFAGDTLIEPDQGRLRVFPLDGRQEMDVTVPVSLFPQRLVSLQNAVVWVGAGRAHFLKTPFEGQVGDLGAADSVIAGPNPGQVWVVRGHSPTPVTVQMGCVDGGGVQCGPGLSPPFIVPDRLMPVADAGNNLILIGPTSGSPAAAVAWDPFGGNIKFRFPSTLRDVIDANVNLVAWRGTDSQSCTDGRCPLHLTDIASGKDEIVTPPPGHDGFIEGGSFSPDGRHLAVFAVDPSNPHAARPVIRNITAGTTELCARTVPVAGSIDAAVWDPNGGAVFVAGTSGTLMVCQPGATTAADLNLPAAYTFAVL
jgi:hypothetical protein